MNRARPVSCADHKHGRTFSERAVLTAVAPWRINLQVSSKKVRLTSEVKAGVVGGGLCPRVGDVTAGVQMLGRLHRCRRRHSQP
jgi:hypothetical protein